MLVSSFKRLIFFFYEAMCLFGLKDTFLKYITIFVYKKTL